MNKVLIFIAVFLLFGCNPDERSSVSEKKWDGVYEVIPDEIKAGLPTRLSVLSDGDTDKMAYSHSAEYDQETRVGLLIDRKSAQNSLVTGFKVGRYPIQSLLINKKVFIDDFIDVLAGDPHHIEQVSGNEQFVVAGKETAFPLTSRIVDAWANPIVAVPVDYLPLTGGGFLIQNPTVTNSEGLSSSVYTAGTVKGRARIKASTQLILVADPKEVFFDLTIIADAPAKLEFKVQPSELEIAGEILSRQPIVQVLDQYGNLIEEKDDLPVSLSAYSDPECLIPANQNVFLLSPQDKKSILGEAAFSEVALIKSGNWYLRASSGNLESDCSSLVVIKPHTPIKLDIYPIPEEVRGCSETLAPITVSILDKFENVTESSSLISLEIIHSSNSGVMTGKTQKTSIHGVAKFDDLAVTKAGDGYSISATSSGLESDVSNRFNVMPGKVSHVEIIDQPHDANVNENIGPVKVSAKDSCGNVAEESATANIEVNPSGGVLSGTNPTQGNLAVFPDLSINNPGLGYTLKIIVGEGFVISNPFNIYPLPTNEEPEEEEPNPEHPTVDTKSRLYVDSFRSCAINNSGNLYCWGRSFDGPFKQEQKDVCEKSMLVSAGNNLYSTIDRECAKSPKLISLNEKAASIENGCVLLSNGEVQCWGQNENGALGQGFFAEQPDIFGRQLLPNPDLCETGSFIHSVKPSFRHQCSQTPLTVIGAESGVSSLSTTIGESRGVCIVSSGSLKCFGGLGYFGNGITGYSLNGSPYGHESHAIPIQVNRLESGVSKAALGGGVNCAIKDGGLMCWGHNFTTHALGLITWINPRPSWWIGSSTYTEEQMNDAKQRSQTMYNFMLAFNLVKESFVPIEIPTLESGISDVAASGTTVCAIQNGAVKCMGVSDYGQTGIGYDAPINNPTSKDILVVLQTPRAIPGLESGITKIKSDARNLFCLIQNGALKCMGQNNILFPEGQPCLIKQTMQKCFPVPTVIPGFESDVIDFALSGENACVMMSSGSVKCWGSNTWGATGIGKSTDVTNLYTRKATEYELVPTDINLPQD